MILFQRSCSDKRSKRGIKARNRRRSHQQSLESPTVAEQERILRQEDQQNAPVDLALEEYKIVQGKIDKIGDFRRRSKVGRLLSRLEYLRAVSQRMFLRGARLARLLRRSCFC